MEGIIFLILVLERKLPSEGKFIIGLIQEHFCQWQAASVLESKEISKQLSKLLLNITGAQQTFLENSMSNCILIILFILQTTDLDITKQYLSRTLY